MSQGAHWCWCLGCCCSILGKSQVLEQIINFFFNIIHPLFLVDCILRCLARLTGEILKEFCRGYQISNLGCSELGKGQPVLRCHDSQEIETINKRFEKEHGYHPPPPPPKKFFCLRTSPAPSKRLL